LLSIWSLKLIIFICSYYCSTAQSANWNDTNCILLSVYRVISLVANYEISSRDNQIGWRDILRPRNPFARSKRSQIIANWAATIRCHDRGTKGKDGWEMVETRRQIIEIIIGEARDEGDGHEIGMHFASRAGRFHLRRFLRHEAAG